MRSLLVALDASPRSSFVLERAAAIAREMQAELYLLRAVGLPREIPEEALRLSPDELVERWKREAATDLERRAATLPPELVTHILVRIGAPWAAICAAAREHDVEVIVIGSHGYDALDHVLGTTAAKVVNHADRSVFVVRPTAPR